MSKIFERVLAHRQAIQRKRYEESLVRNSNAVGTTYRLSSALDPIVKKEKQRSRLQDPDDFVNQKY